MKHLKFLPVLITFIFFGCSSDDDSSSSNEYFNPPSWIQGTWEVNGTPLYKFTDDDFILIASGQETSFKGLLSANTESGGVSSVDESISDLEYDFTINSGFSSTITSNSYEFKKIDENTIEYVNYPYGGTISNYYLYRVEN